MIRQIQTDEKILNRKSEKVDIFDEDLIVLTKDMIETMIQSEGVGLAAPQINVMKRIIVVNTGDKVEAFINPEIIKKSLKKEKQEEGCLSVPGCILEISRPKQVKIKAQTVKGDVIEIEAEDLTARIFQHEIDHLNGILINQRASLKNRIKNKIKK